MDHDERHRDVICYLVTEPPLPMTGMPRIFSAPPMAGELASRVRLRRSPSSTLRTTPPAQSSSRGPAEWPRLVELGAREPTG